MNNPDVTEQQKTPAASTPASGSVDGLPENTPCWCGEPNPHYEPMRGGCDGHGYQNCRCGGDFCVCHNHGEIECFGCPDCEGNDDDDYTDE